jgi:UMF1 family MFS transporter
MIPANEEAKYFGLYEISERGTAWLGTAAFGLAVQLTGSQRVAIITLIVFFIVGLLLLSRVNVRQAITEAGNDPKGVDI